MQTETNLNPAGHSVTDYVPETFSFCVGICFVVFVLVLCGLSFTSTNPVPLLTITNNHPKQGIY